MPNETQEVTYCPKGKNEILKKLHFFNLTQSYIPVLLLYPLKEDLTLYFNMNLLYTRIMWNHLNSRGQFSWFVNFLQVRGDVISWIGWLGGGGGKER